MSCAQEFATVDLVLRSEAETRGVDAFALSLIKCERQVRRLVTHLVYQFPCFGCSDIASLRKSLSANRTVYFEGFVRGFDALYPRPVKELVETGYDDLRTRLAEAIDFRNKIFHGQLTQRYLSREDLLGYVGDIRKWCEALANGAENELGYDGFTRDSFRKSPNTGISERFKVQFTNAADYDQFIQRYMARHSIALHGTG